jgi:hypothetical protein
MKKYVKNLAIIAMMIIVTAVFVACNGERRDTRAPLPPPVNIVIEATPTSITFVNNDNPHDYAVLEVCVNGSDWQDGLTITGLAPNTQYTACARYKETEKYKAGDQFTREVTTLKYEQNAPAASFTQADKTITVETNAAFEYSFDGGETYGAANVHTYTENGEKTVKVRYKETSEKYAGEEQAISVNNRDYYGGFGTESDPYLIGTPAHFNALVNPTKVSYYRLTADVDFTETIISPVSLGNCIFDGNGHKLINPAISMSAQGTRCGVFAGIAVVKNLTVENAEIDFATSTGNVSAFYVGIIAGEAQVVENCKVSGVINITNNGTSGQESYVGGIAGRIRDGITASSFGYKVTDSFSDVSIGYNSPNNTTGTLFVGGLFGADERATVATVRIALSRSAANLDIELLGTYGANVGGLCGSMRGDIDNCYATGSIVTDGSGGNISIGGVASSVTSGNIDSCYAAMNLSANGKEQNVFIGGIVRSATGTDAQTLSNCFFSGNIYITEGGGKTAMSDSLAVGTLPAAYTVANCYHSNNLTTPTTTSKSTAVSEGTIKTTAWQRDTLLLSADVWNFADGDYPTLK